MPRALERRAVQACDKPNCMVTDVQDIVFAGCDGNLGFGNGVSHILWHSNPFPMCGRRRKTSIGVGSRLMLEEETNHIAAAQLHVREVCNASYCRTLVRTMVDAMFQTWR